MTRLSSRNDLRHRYVEDEIMDDPDLDEGRHFAALAGLSRLNWLSGSTRILWRPIRDAARRLGVSRLRVLDIATGAGDLPIGLWHRARRSGLDLELHGLDISPQALSYAEQRAKSVGATIQFSEHDVFEKPLPNGFDVIVSSLFLHHLSEDQAKQLLTAMRQATEHAIVINDLQRCTGGLWLTRFAVHAFTRSEVVHVDGVRSVRAAFSVDEVRQLADDNGLRDAVIQRCWPFRFALTWHKTVEAD